MNEYFVAGGVFPKMQGEEFELASPGPGESPYVLADSIMDYFRTLSANAHLYRVEADYSLSLVASSPEALQRGVKAPETVGPDARLIDKLRHVVRHEASTFSPDGQG